MKAIPLVGADSFRYLATMVIPSTLAVGPWLYRLYSEDEEAALTWMESHAGWAAVAFVIGYVAVGMVLENLGSLAEARWLDKVAKKKNANHEKEWHQYLRMAFEIEPVGQRYIRTILMRMKFELATGAACAIAAGTSLVLGYWVAAVLMIGVAAYMFWEAKSSHGILATMRHEFCESGIQKLPAD